MNKRLASILILATIGLVVLAGCRLGAAAGIVKTPTKEPGSTKEVSTKVEPKSILETALKVEDGQREPKGSEVEAATPDVPPIPIVYLLLAG